MNSNFRAWTARRKLLRRPRQTPGPGYPVRVAGSWSSAVRLCRPCLRDKGTFDIDKEGRANSFSFGSLRLSKLFGDFLSRHLGLFWSTNSQGSVAFR